jgi:hypothetical protein
VVHAHGHGLCWLVWAAVTAAVAVAAGAGAAGVIEVATAGRELLLELLLLPLVLAALLVRALVVWAAGAQGLGVFRSRREIRLRGRERGRWRGRQGAAGWESWGGAEIAAAWRRRELAGWAPPGGEHWLGTSRRVCREMKRVSRPTSLGEFYWGGGRDCTSPRCSLLPLGSLLEGRQLLQQPR